jgi:DNA-directed RNA polymerase subunit M/transcription elongation factor TFIIS
VYNWSIEESKLKTTDVYNFSRKKMIKEITDLWEYAILSHSPTSHSSIQQNYQDLLYKRKSRQIIGCMTNVKGFIERLKNDNVFLRSVPYMKNVEIVPREPKTTKNEVVRPNIPGLFRCNNCQSFNTVNTQVQTRGADEPMTIYITCNECNTVRKE